MDAKIITHGGYPGSGEKRNPLAQRMLRHAPEDTPWIPAFAGMTRKGDGEKRDNLATECADGADGADGRDGRDGTGKNFAKYFSFLRGLAISRFAGRAFGRPSAFAFCPAFSTARFPLVFAALFVARAFLNQTPANSRHSHAGENPAPTYSRHSRAGKNPAPTLSRHSRESGNPVRYFRPEGPRIQNWSAGVSPASFAFLRASRPRSIQNIPLEGGQFLRRFAPEWRWIPAFAGMTGKGNGHRLNRKRSGNLRFSQELTQPQERNDDDRAR